MPVKVLKDYLDNQHVKYKCIAHSPEFTSQEIAASAHISGKQLAKTIIVKIDDQLAMVVLPANEKIDLAALTKVTHAKNVNLASEFEFKGKFPECEVGAMPPFGNLFGMPVFASNHLGQYEQMLFNSGTHSELMKLAYLDFLRLVNPRVITMH